MDDFEKQDLRAARNHYNSSVSEARGYTSGKRVQNVKYAERRLKQLLWEHRDYLINAVTDPINIR